MGLGSVQKSNKTYLAIGGGFIWDKTKDETNPDYAEQEFNRADGTVGVRKGAQYGNLTGKVLFVEFKQHDQYGESIRVTVESGGVEYILSVGTNNAYSQHLMKALLLMDKESVIFINPYDFVDTKGKRAQGVSFKQGGQKLNLRDVELPAKLNKEKDFWTTASKKDKKRYFEDLAEHLVAEVTSEVCPFFKAPENNDVAPSQPVVSKEVEKVKVVAEVVEAEAQPEVVLPSQIKMKKAIKAYIEENYDGETMPKLSRDQVVIWYNLVLAEEELPIGVSESSNEVSSSDLKEDLASLLGK
jgi:hypothetical protein